MSITPAEVGQNLPSNPKGPLDEAVKDKFSKPTT